METAGKKAKAKLFSRGPSASAVVGSAPSPMMGLATFNEQMRNAMLGVVLQNREQQQCTVHMPPDERNLERVPIYLHEKRHIRVDGVDGYLKGLDGHFF